MAITGRTLEEAARTFTDHLNGVLNRTVTQARLVFRRRVSEREVYISFRQGGQPAVVPLGSRYGRVDLFVAQACSSEVIDGLHYLGTHRYTCTLTPERPDEPLSESWNEVLEESYRMFKTEFTAPP